MPSRRATEMMVVVCALAFSGCGTLQKVMPARKRVPRAQAVPGPMAVGTISLVNEPSHFVLIDNGDLPAPAVGTMLKSYSGGKESGELLATEVRKRPFIIADIKSGAPQKGDRVMQPPTSDTGTPSSRNARGEEHVPIMRAEPVAPAEQPRKKRFGLF